MLKYLSLFLIAVLPLALIAFAPLDGSTLPVPVEAQEAVLQNPTVRIDPAASVVGAGETFTVAVMIDNASNLGGFEFDLFFDPSTLRANSVTLGNFLGSTGRMVIPVGPTIDNQVGRVGFGAASIGSAPGPNGTGVLATITFTTQGSGESPLDLQDVMVLDINAQHQTATVEDGVVRVRFAVYLPLVLRAW